MLTVGIPNFFKKTTILVRIFRETQLLERFCDTPRLSFDYPPLEYPPLLTGSFLAGIKKRQTRSRRISN